MPKITIASLERRILVLESEKQTLGGQLSINGEFQLEAFKLLLVKLKEEEQKLLLSLSSITVLTMKAPEPVVIDDVLWKPYSVNHIDADGKKFSFYIFAISREHAACVVDDIRETAWLGDEVVG